MKPTCFRPCQGWFPGKRTIGKGGGDRRGVVWGYKAGGGITRMWPHTCGPKYPDFGNALTEIGL